MSMSRDTRTTGHPVPQCPRIVLGRPFPLETLFPLKPQLETPLETPLETSLETPLETQLETLLETLWENLISTSLDNQKNSTVS